MKFYQPQLYFDDGTNIGWDLPTELQSDEVFDNEEDCIEFMQNKGYLDEDFIVTEFEVDDDDVEEYIILDVNGTRIN